MSISPFCNHPNICRITFVIGIVFCFILRVHAATTVITDTTLTVNTTWSDTIQLNDCLYIPSGKTLTLSPGTIVFAQAAGVIYISGTLMASGTETDSIIFTAADTAKGWKGLRFGANLSNISIISFGSIRYVKNEMTLGALTMEGNKGLTLRHCRITKNSTKYWGAALNLTNSNLTVEHSVFTENHAVKSGGVIYASVSTMTSTDCIFSDNTSSGSTSVINSGGDSRISFINCIITGNSSSGTSGSGCIIGSTLSIINCTITKNSSPVPGFNFWGSRIINTLFWDNALSDSIVLSSTTPENCLVGQDPLFTSYADGDYSLSELSPCIDAGRFDTTKLLLPATDMAGNPRIHCSVIDIGAFEFQNTPNCAPFLIDTSAVLSLLYSTPLKIDTRLLRVVDTDDNDFTFIIEQGTGYTVGHDTIYIDSGYTDTIRISVRITDGTSTTRSALVKIAPLYPPQLLSVDDQTIRQEGSLLFSTAMIKMIDLNGDSLSVILHGGENYTLSGKQITPQKGFSGTLSVPVHVWDGLYSSDTLVMTIIVRKNGVPVISEATSQRIVQYGKLQFTMSMISASDDENDRLYPVIGTGENYTLEGQVIIPDTSFYGTLQIPIRVTDLIDTSDAVMLELIVDKYNHRPVILSTKKKIVKGCTGHVITMDLVSAEDPDGDELSLIVAPGAGYTVRGDTVDADPCGYTLLVKVLVTDGTLLSDTAIVNLTMLSLWTDSPIPLESRPLSRNGKLTIKKGQLCNRYGLPIQLKGMSSHGLQWYSNYFNKQSIEWLVTNWQVSVIRAAMYTADSGYITDSGLMNRVIEIAQWAEEAGIYCIIDWHILEDGDPNIYKTEAIEFFRGMAQLFKEKEHILYEICNEPNGKITWKNEVRPYAEDLITVIREHDSDAVILVGTPNWSQDVDMAAADPLPYNNIAYALHFYAGSHDEFLKRKARIALDSGIALFATEWGTSDATGSGGVYISQSDSWLRLLDSAGISWCNWSLSDKAESSAALRPKADTLGGWPDSMLSASGLYVRECIRKDQLNDVPALLPLRRDTVRIGDSVSVRCRATDPELFGQLSWTLSGHPHEMKIDSSGYITWLADSAGVFNVKVTVTDDSGADSSILYKLLVEPPVSVDNQPGTFRAVSLRQHKGEILFHYSLESSTDYRIRIYSVAGRVLKEISGTTGNNRRSHRFNGQIRTRIEASGIYLVEFAYVNHAGKTRKLLSTLLCK